VLAHLHKCQLQGQQKYTNTTQIYKNGKQYKTQEQQIWEQQQQQRRSNNIHYHHHKQRRQKNKNSKQGTTKTNQVLN
jgi:hypothetical protein